MDTTLGEDIDALHATREELRAANEVIEEIKSRIAAAEAALLERMEKEGVKKATGSRATISVSTVVLPQVEDWNRFHEYIKENDFFHLLERRPSAPGCRELFERDGAIPGVVPFMKRKLNLRSE